MPRRGWRGQWQTGEGSTLSQRLQTKNYPVFGFARKCLLRSRACQSPCFPCLALPWHRMWVPLAPLSGFGGIRWPCGAVAGAPTFGFAHLFFLRKNIAIRSPPCFPLLPPLAGGSLCIIQDEDHRYRSRAYLCGLCVPGQRPHDHLVRFFLFLVFCFVHLGSLVSRRLRAACGSLFADTGGCEC